MFEAKFKMVIKTDQYTGDFERAMGAFLFGYSNGTCRDADDFYEDFRAELGENKAEEIMNYLHLFYEEHGETICEVEEPDSKALTFYFEKSPKKIKNFILERLKKFPAALFKKEFAPEGLKIKSVKFYKIEVKETEI